MIRLGSFDTETTGVDVETDRIVSAALVILEADGTLIGSHTWLLNPGVPIPDEATAVHGITTERAQTEGQDAAAGTLDIAAAVVAVVETCPLVVFNAPFDLTLLDREFRRHHGQGFEAGGLETEGELVDRYVPIRPVIDPLVIDKHLDKYRKGKRTLTAMAELYGIPLGDDAHGAEADATAAGRIAQALIGRTGAPGPGALHDAQIRWAAEQADSFRDYRRSRGEDWESIDGTWPVRPLPNPPAVLA